MKDKIKRLFKELCFVGSLIILTPYFIYHIIKEQRGQKKLLKELNEQRNDGSIERNH